MDNDINRVAPQNLLRVVVLGIVFAATQSFAASIASRWFTNGHGHHL